MRNSSCPKIFFPCEHDTGWVKEHGRLQRWRIQTKAVSPEAAGLTGCWQFIAVWRERQYLRAGKVVKEEEEYSYYAASLYREQYTAKEMLAIIRGHWGAVENGLHHRRDASMGEDDSRIAQRTQAHVMASLRNLTLSLYERDKRLRGFKDSYPSWQRKMTASKAFKLLTRKN